MDSNLRDILNRQRDVLAELDSEVKVIEDSDLTKENEQLKADLKKLQTAHQKSEQNVKALFEQNANLKNTLYEQVYNEKVKIVNTSRKKMDVYFKSNYENEVNRLTVLENSIKSRIDSMTSSLRRYNVDINDDTNQKLGELAVQVNYKITEVQKQHAESHGAFSINERAEFEKLKNEQITDEQVLAVAKKNNIERFVGLNLLNVIGILLIIIGVITAARFTYVQLPDMLRGIMMFTLGAIMLVVGEIMNRKKPNVFTLGITAGGVAVLYVALGISYFGLEILDMYPALALCVLITAVAFFLSTRYNSQTILAFALIGGYLPLFSIGSDKTMIYGAMVYFVVLNLLALLVSFKKKWSVSSFIGLGLNIIGTIYIISNFWGNIPIYEKIIAVSYVLFAFLVYTIIPIIGTYKAKSIFKKRDVVLLALNTFFSSLITFILFYAFGWEDFTGILSIVFAVIYLTLGWLIERKFDGEKHTQALFYLTGLAFVVLVIPFQFGRAWLTLGWLAEGVALTTYGILKDEKNFKRAGYAINALCLAAFLTFDLRWDIDFLFAYKYLAITLGSLIILGAYVYKKMLSSGWQKAYKYAVITNLWFYVIYVIGQLENLLFRQYEQATTYSISYLTAALTIVATFLIACVAPRIKILSDMGTKIISIILYIIGILWLVALNSTSSPIHISEPSIGITLVGTLVLVVIGVLSVFAMRDLVKLIVMERKLAIEWYPLIISAYFVIILTQNLITQYNLSFTSVWISIIYVLTALAWILFGFAKRYSFIRRFGLGLALLAVAKLFILDLASLTEGYRIVSYFILGITLVAISFVYQYFNKRLELKLGVADDVSKDS
ncbi:MAG: DUF2339 domain-containing protein [Oscillospiraceae bacterium]|jgi:uncharacterized membrane protein|nr:DUF2339 domain-containing protein [Oscillospiraceae bacterium]